VRAGGETWVPGTIGCPVADGVGCGYSAFEERCLCGRFLVPFVLNSLLIPWDPVVPKRKIAAFHARDVRVLSGGLP
jgi:hypothetical protein